MERVVKCLVCGRDITIDKDGFLDGAGKLIAHFGYGSRHDQIGVGSADPAELEPHEKLLQADQIRGYICDDCYEQKYQMFDAFRLIKTYNEVLIKPTP